MRAESSELWLNANQRFLSSELERILAAIERLKRSAAPPAQSVAPDPLDRPAAIEQLQAAFALTPFERDLLLLAAGVELDSRIARACGEAQGLGRAAPPTFSLALVVFPDAHWSALHPNSALRQWRLIRVGVGELLTTSALRIEESALHFLTGIDAIDTQLQIALREVSAASPLTPTQINTAAGVRLAVSRGGSAQLHGATLTTRRALAWHAVRKAGWRLFRLNAADIPLDAAEQAEWVALWRRDAVLCGGVLLVETDESDDATHASRLRTFAAGLEVPFLLSSRDPIALDGVQPHGIEVPNASREELRALCVDTSERESWARVVEHFPLDVDCATRLLANSGSDEGQLWRRARAEKRRAMDGLAQRIEPCAEWGDLVLPESTLQQLRDIARHVRLRHQVHGDWGFESKSRRGLSISALFTGPSGTGKTMAAEVLARDLALDLYRIDLSAVVSKYIGETEKNLKRIFDAAEAGGALLLFDEADALFGKRSEVRDSHDRYANVEIAYLLQRMEAYRGLAILTTNLKQTLDEAFLRRIRFVVSFPFPAARERAEIWRRVFPAATPVNGLDYLGLARLAVAGGNIRNIALGAAFIAAEQQRPVTMDAVLQAARSEYAKLERPMAELEIGGRA